MFIYLFFKLNLANILLVSIKPVTIYRILNDNYSNESNKLTNKKLLTTPGGP